MKEDMNNVDSAFVQDDELYGKKLNPTPPPQRNIGIDLDAQFLNQLAGEGVSSHVDIAKIDAFSQVSQNREVIYQLLDTMAQDPTIASVLEVYAEDATETNDDGRIVWVESDDSDCAKYITYLLDTMGVDKYIYKWTYSLCKYGDLYLRLYRNSELEDGLFNEKENKENERKQKLREEVETYKELHEGALPSKEELQQMNEDVIVKIFSKDDRYSHYVEAASNPAEMFELTKFGKSYAYIKAPTINTSTKKDNLMSSQYLYSFQRKDVEVFEATEYVHASLEDDSSRNPEEVEIFMDENNKPLKYSVRRGQSLLYNSFKIWRQMMLLENTLLLNRLTKSSIVRIIGVEVGDMPKENIGKHLMGIKQLVEQKSAINEGTSMEEYTNPGPMENNIYVPTYNGIGSISTQQVGGDVDVKGLADIEYFQNKLFGALRTPKQFLGVTDDNTGFNGGTSLSIISSRYAKMVKRIQSTMIQLLTDAVNLMLIDKGLEGKYLNKFSLHMVPPTTQEEIDRRDNLSNKVGIARDIMDLTADIEDTSSRLKILKSLMSGIITDPDILEIIQEEIELQEELSQSTDTIDDVDDDMNIPSGMHRATPSPNMDLGDNPIENEEPNEEPADDEQVLPTPGQLDVGDLSDNSNPEL